jgi:hypothetical protein
MTVSPSESLSMPLLSPCSLLLLPSAPQQSQLLPSAQQPQLLPSPWSPLPRSQQLHLQRFWISQCPLPRSQQLQLQRFWTPQCPLPQQLPR